MARDSDQLAGFENENTGGLLTGFLADEDVFDRRALWRLGSWGAVSVGAVIVALYANQSSISMRREQVAAADIARQAQQIQSVAKQSQTEARRLASAIDTLNDDRDRLYTRVTTLEQGLDSVTGAITRQNGAAAAPPAASAPQAGAAPATASAAEPPPAAKNSTPVPVVAPVATTVAATVAKATDKPPADTAAPEPAPVTVSSVAKSSNAQAAVNPPAAPPPPPLVASKSIMAPPDAAAAKLIEPEKPPKPVAAAKSEVVASTAPADDAEADAAPVVPKLAAQRTEFGVDVGGANSVGGLRALWRGLLKSKSNAALTTLRPIIVIREGSNGLGMQLRLVAGPIGDAAAAAKICAGLIENDRPCETAVYDGQRLAMTAEEPAATASPTPDKPTPDKPAVAKPPAARPSAHKRSFSKRVENDEPAKKPEPTSTLSSFFSRR